MKIAIIPARGGSKRIPRKNIREFSGKPMIAHAISAAKQLGLFEHVVVSTDDEEIACIARAWGAETPFTRPAELADDYTPTVPVIAHAITACQAIGWSIDYACCIYPGVPFIQADDLKRALELLQTSQAAYSFPVTEFPSAIQRALRRLPECNCFTPNLNLPGRKIWNRPITTPDSFIGAKRMHGSPITTYIAAVLGCPSPTGGLLI
jgi:pseudaminic acid cytidylyltransferase